MLFTQTQLTSSQPNHFSIHSTLFFHTLLHFFLKGMECVQETLKGVFGSELTAFGGPNGDDLFVDELLDFSNAFSETEEPDEKEPEKKIAFCSVLHDQKHVGTVSKNNVLTGKDDFVSFPETQLTLPAEDLENLEWLSHFVDDSFSDYSLTIKLPPKSTEPAVQVPCFTTPVQTKARTKRTRTGVRVWPVLSPSSSSDSSTTSFISKKRKTGESQPRRCSHCGVTKTPQWRAGPLGSKTLCNACGVRFKSGRLLPEYRPACSPTFSMDLHSNNHRKVLEMRRKKESGTDEGGQTGLVRSISKVEPEWLLTGLGMGRVYGSISH